MKKIISLLLAICMVFAFAACGETSEKEPEGTKVYVSISKSGEIQLAAETIYVKDTDNNGLITINEVLQQAHEQKYNGTDGYKAEDSGYGLAIATLWGDTNGGSYGYYKNNVSSYNLEETVIEGDYIYAYSYKDLTTWSDTYTYFDVFQKTSENGEVTLRLTAAGFDENWNPVEYGVEGAEITSGGKLFGMTDANGEITFTIPGSGEYTIVAHHDALTIVPAICNVTVK